MFLISYPDSKTGEITTRLCEIQQTRDGDLMIIQHGKIVKDEEPCYRRLKPDKIQGIEALKPIDVHSLITALEGSGMSVPKDRDWDSNPFMPE